MFSSVISAIENCGVIVHSNDSLINRRESLLPPLLCVTQWGRRARDGPGGGGMNKRVKGPKGRKRRGRKEKHL